MELLLAIALEGGFVVEVEVVETQNPVASSLQGHGDVGPDEAGGAGDEDGNAGVGAAASRACDEALPVGAAIGAERSARVGARRRREKEKEAEDG